MATITLSPALTTNSNYGFNMLEIQDWIGGEVLRNTGEPTDNCDYYPGLTLLGTDYVFNLQGVHLGSYFEFEESSLIQTWTIYRWSHPEVLHSPWSQFFQRNPEGNLFMTPFEQVGLYQGFATATGLNYAPYNVMVFDQGYTPEGEKTLKGIAAEWAYAMAGNDTVKGSTAKETIAGFNGNDILTGCGGDDTIQGGSGNDTLAGEQGNDLLDGGLGRDLAKFNGAMAEYSTRMDQDGITVEHLVSHNDRQGTDYLVNIERLQFSDKSVALDITDNALDTLQFLGVIAPSLQGNLNVRGSILSLFDQGKSMQEMSQLALDLGLITSDNIVLAKTVFKNVFNTTADPDQNLTNTLVNFIEQNGDANFIATVAGLNLNVDLVGLQQHGMKFI